jgi:hypothetical protein
MYAISVKNWLRRLPPPDIVMNEMNKVVCLGASFESLLERINPVGFDAPQIFVMNEMNKMVCLGASFESLLGKGNPVGFDCPQILL